jgi:replicative DNA helicase
MGKTALATCMAVNLARGGHGVYVASLETSEGEVTLRMACSEAGIHLLDAIKRELSHAEWSRLTNAYRDLATLPIHIDDTPALRLVDLWSKCRRVQLAFAREGHPLACVVVDYVQLMADARPGMKREEAVAKNARGLANLARELGVTVLGLVQLNRAVETRADKRPQLSDLRESGEFEQAARTVLLVYRDDYYPKGSAPTKRAEIRIAKQNNGPSGDTVLLGFEGAHLRFSNLPEGET